MAKGDCSNTPSAAGWRGLLSMVDSSFTVAVRLWVKQCCCY